MAEHGERQLAPHVVAGMAAVQLKPVARGAQPLAGHVQAAMNAAKGQEALQRMSVVQLATRLSSQFAFIGSTDTLRNLILRWGPPRGTNVVLAVTDHTGQSYKARFTNNGGPAISKATADQWVQAGLSHYNDSSESSSSSEDSSSSSDDEA